MEPLRWALRRAVAVPGVKTAGRATVRRAAMLTANRRPGPDFIVIGAKRAGTTSLFRYLEGHRQILPLVPSARILPLGENVKGVHFFDSNWTRGSRWYRSHFALAATRSRRARKVGAPVVTGEASPYYLFHPAAAARAAGLVPQVKIVLMLRDPVVRTFSHWKEQTRNGVETLGFEEALAAEAGRLGDAESRLAQGATSRAHEHQGYRRQSEYSDGLARWLEAYPRKNVLVIWSEDFYADPARELGKVCDHLGIGRIPVPAGQVWNAAPSAAGPAPETVRALREHFRPYDQALESLLGETPPWRAG